MSSWSGGGQRSGEQQEAATQTATGGRWSILPVQKKKKKKKLQCLLGLCGAAVIVMNSGGHCSDRHEKLFMPRTAQDNDAAVC